MTDGRAYDLVIFDWAGTMVDFGCCAPIGAYVQAYMGIAKVDHVRALLARPDVAHDWKAAQGRGPTEVDVDALMEDLGPLMRDAAAVASELIPGAVATVNALRERGLRIGSSTGYTREMMGPVLARAAAQGYVPDHVVCAGETPQGRPSPLMIYKACAELGVWPLSRVVKVDDSESGIAEGRAAGCFTVGIAASGNAIGLSREAFQALDHAERDRRLAAARASLMAAGADAGIDSVADLPGLIQSR